MIEDKHRVAALAVMATDAELEEAIPPEIWSHLVDTGRLEYESRGKGRIKGLRLTDAGREFLRRSLG